MDFAHGEKVEHLRGSWLEPPLNGAMHSCFAMTGLDGPDEVHLLTIARAEPGAVRRRLQASPGNSADA